MTIALVTLAAVVVAQWIAFGLFLRHHLRTLDRQVAERDTWSRERFDLNTRLQAPSLAPLMSPPSPTGLGPAETPPPAEEQEPDESELVGTIA